MKPIVYDLYCGLGGWSEGFLAEGYECIGFDVEAHDYGTGGYPGKLILRDVRSIHGSELKDAAVIVASPPCQAYSYRAMPWKRAKALPPPDNTLFNECFRIQREAIAAAGHYIPLIVENVRGAQPWVGRARWNYGSFYPALMPTGRVAAKVPGLNWKVGSATYSGKAFNDTAVAQMNGVKQAGISVPRKNGKGNAWFQDGAARHGSKSTSRKAASAMIAKIPLPLSQHIARTFKPIDTHAIFSPAGGSALICQGI